MKKEALLGIFDSGVGGLSVYTEVRKHTSADILYFGDCARAPYGNRSESEIVDFIKEIVLHLQAEGVTHFVSACNSMSVLTTKKLLQDMGIPEKQYLDMVSAVTMIPFEKESHVLIIGTKATIASDVYQSILNDKKISYEVFSPYLLAGDIEKGDHEAIISSIKEIIEFAVNGKATHILYACTHYPLVNDMFTREALRFLPSWTGVFVDPAHYIAESVEEWNIVGDGTTSFETSLETEVFKDYSKRF